MMPEEVMDDLFVEVKFDQGQGGSIRSQSPDYLAWISEYEQRTLNDIRLQGEWTTRAVFRGRCGSASHEMRVEFPELRLVRGTVTHKDQAGSLTSEDLQELIMPDDGHIWLETPTGEVVDPTVKQFLRPETLFYIAFDESKADQLPTGKCPNCGDYCFNGRDLCSDECATSYAAYIMRECRF